jgi:hypothetical protein
VANANIRLLLDGTPDGDIARGQPGARLRGTVQVRPSGGDVKCSHLFVRAKWHTEGRGTRNEGVGAQADVFQGILPGGEVSTFPFDLPLPKEPWSYAGRYVSIVWAVEVDVDVPWSTNPRHGRPFVLRPEPIHDGEDPVAPPPPEFSDPTFTTVDAGPAGRFDLVLLAAPPSGDAHQEFVAALRDVEPRLTVLQAEEMVQSAPTPLLTGVPWEDATLARRRMEMAGAQVEVRPHPEDP